MPFPVLHFSVSLRHWHSFPLRFNLNLCHFPFPLSPVFGYCSDLSYFLWAASLPFSLSDTSLSSVLIVRGHTATLRQAWVRVAGRDDKEGFPIGEPLWHEIHVSQPYQMTASLGCRAWLCSKQHTSWDALEKLGVSFCVYIVTFAPTAYAFLITDSFFFSREYECPSPELCTILVFVILWYLGIT